MQKTNISNTLISLKLKRHTVQILKTVTTTILTLDLKEDVFKLTNQKQMFLVNVSLHHASK